MSMNEATLPSDELSTPVLRLVELSVVVAISLALGVASTFVWKPAPPRRSANLSIQGAPLDSAVDVRPTVSMASNGQQLPLATFEVLGGFFYDIPNRRDYADIDAFAKEANALIPQEVRDWNGKTSAVKGYMIPVLYEGGKVKTFILSRYQPACCFGQSPKINEWVYITLPQGQTVDAMHYQTVTATGKFEVGVDTRMDRIMSIYRMQADTVEAEPFQ